MGDVAVAEVSEQPVGAPPEPGGRAPQARAPFPVTSAGDFAVPVASYGVPKSRDTPSLPAVNGSPTNSPDELRRHAPFELSPGSERLSPRLSLCSAAAAFSRDRAAAVEPKRETSARGRRRRPIISMTRRSDSHVNRSHKTHSPARAQRHREIRVDIVLGAMIENLQDSNRKGTIRRRPVARKPSRSGLLSRPPSEGVGGVASSTSNVRKARLGGVTLADYQTTACISVPEKGIDSLAPARRVLPALFPDCFLTLLCCLEATVPLASQHTEVFVGRSQHRHLQAAKLQSRCPLSRIISLPAAGALRESSIGQTDTSRHLNRFSDTRREVALLKTGFTELLHVGTERTGAMAASASSMCPRSW